MTRINTDGSRIMQRCSALHADVQTEAHAYYVDFVFSWATRPPLRRTAIDMFFVVY